MKFGSEVDKDASTKLNKSADVELLEFYEQLKSISNLKFSTELELVNDVLEKLIESTNSHIGFAHFVNDDQETLDLTTWSAETLGNCSVVFDSHYPIKKAGIWVESFYQRRTMVYNNYESAKNKKGLPSGHFPLKRFISTPIIRDFKVKMIVGIGNKESDYDIVDVKMIEANLDLFWNILENFRSNNLIATQKVELSKLYTTFNLLDEMIMIVDYFKNIEFVNKSYCEHFSADCENIRNRNVLQSLISIFGTEIASNIIFQLNSVLTDNIPNYYEIKFNGKFYKITIKKISVRESHFYKYLIKFEDITQSRAYEKMLLYQNKVLELNRDCYYAINESISLDDLFSQYCTLSSLYLKSEIVFVCNHKRLADGINLINTKSYYSKNINYRLPSNEIEIRHQDYDLPFDMEEQTIQYNVANQPQLYKALGLDESYRMYVTTTSNNNYHWLLINCYKSEDQVNNDFNGLANLLLGRMKLGIDLLYQRHYKEKAEELLSGEKDQLSIYLNSIADGVLTLNETGNVIYVSNRLLNILEIEFGKIIGKKLDDFLTLYDEKLHEIEFNPRAIINSSPPENALYRYFYITPHNESKNFEIKLKEILINKEQKGIVLIISDITQLMQYQSDLSKSQKLESVGLLSAGIAHEINTPLQFVSDNLYFVKSSINNLFSYSKELEKSLREKNSPINRKLVEKYDMDYYKGEIPKAIDSSYDGISRILKIVKAMKNFAHRSNNEKTLTDINKLIEDSTTLSRNEWKAVADMNLLLGKNLPEINLLPDEITQTFLNLIINSVHAIKSKKNEVDNFRGTISFTSNLIDGYIEIVVEDNGCGIPKNVIDKIFEPFYTTKPVGIGSGQGLAITQDIIIKNHRGLIKVESELGKFTKFFIFLPLDNQVIK